MNPTDSASRWQRVSTEHPCPVCDRPDWCLKARDGSATICARTALGSVRRIGEAGWLHLHGASGLAGRVHRPIVRTIGGKHSPAEMAELTCQFEAASAREPQAALRLARHLGVSPSSLQALGLGWCEAFGAWSFPMHDEYRGVVGIRLRRRNGRKFAIKGSREGLFFSEYFEARDRLLICEGPTDTAAVLDLGYDAVGRPSCRGGVKLLTALVRRLKPAEMIIVADRDAPGQAGALELARRLVALTWVRVITPPIGVKDARAWVRAGATRLTVDQVIEQSPVLGLSVRRREVAHGR